MRSLFYLGFCYRFAGFLVLIFLSAPTALSSFFLPSLSYDFLPQAFVSLIGGDVVDARMVMVAVVRDASANVRNTVFGSR